MRPVGQSDRGRGTADLLHRDAMFEVAHAGTAPFLLDRDAEDAEVTHLAPEVWREGVVAVDGGGARRDFRGGAATYPAPTLIDGPRTDGGPPLTELAGRFLVDNGLLITAVTVTQQEAL